MGATLDINNQSIWMPQTAIFESALELIASGLSKEDQELASKLVEPIGHFPYLDLSSFDQEQFGKISQATQTSYHAVLRSWSANSKFAYFRLMFQVGQLNTMMLLDPRVIQPNDTFGIISFRANVVWKVAAWIYDLVIEHLVAWMREKHDELTASLLLEHMSIDRKIDFTDWNAEQIHEIHACVEFMYKHYGDSEDGRGKVSFSPAFLTPFAPSIVELYEMFRKDDYWIRRGVWP